MDHVARLERIKHVANPVNNIIILIARTVGPNVIETLLDMIAGIFGKNYNPDEDLNEITGDIIFGREGENSITQIIAFIIENAADRDLAIAAWIRAYDMNPPPSYVRDVVGLLLCINDEFKTIVISSDSEDDVPPRKRRCVRKTRSVRSRVNSPCDESDDSSDNESSDDSGDGSDDSLSNDSENSNSDNNDSSGSESGDDGGETNDEIDDNGHSRRCRQSDRFTNARICEAKTQRNCPCGAVIPCHSRMAKDNAFARCPVHRQRDYDVDSA